MLIVPSCTYSVAAFNFWLFLANMETDLYWCLIVKCICFQHTSFPWFTANQSVSWWRWKHGSKPFQLVSAFKSWVRRIFFLLALGFIIWLSKGIGDCWYCWIKVATCQKWCAKKKNGYGGYALSLHHSCSLGWHATLLSVVWHPKEGLERRLWYSQCWLVFFILLLL